MHSEFRGYRTIFYFRFSWGPPFGFFQWIINKFQLKIQRGDPMIIWNQKLFQIHETRCVSTNGQLDITHKFSSKSHNGFPIGAGIILHRVKFNASFCEEKKNLVKRRQNWDTIRNQSRDLVWFGRLNVNSIQGS